MNIKIDHLYKSFNQTEQVLKDINLSDDIHSLAIIGPSGCGKSTLLRIIGGLIAQTSGQIYLDSTPLPQSENARIEHRKKIGFVFQQGGLFSHLSALDNIALPLIEVHNWSKEQAQQQAHALLKRLGLDTHGNKRPHALSGGQRQRIAIARAIAPKPKLLLLDEPTSALDPEYTTEVLDLVKELKDDGIDFIIVTHEMGFARHACDKLAFIYEGKLLEYGSSEQLFNQQQSPLFKQFLGKLLEWKV